MTPEQERWAEALAIEKRYGDDAPVYVAERIGALAPPVMLPVMSGSCRSSSGLISCARDRLAEKRTSR